MKQSFRILALLSFSIILTSSPLLSQKLIGDKQELDQILENISAFSDAVMDGNHEAIGKMYTTDAKIFPNQKDILSGRETITGYWHNPGSSKTIHHKIMPEEIKIIGEEAYDFGYYEGITRKQDGEEIPWRGKYVIVWKKVEGEWLIYLDIWNRIADQ